MKHSKGPIAISADQEAGRLAKGRPDECVFENVKVTCHSCHGVTVFPVLNGQPRKVGACLHCGEQV
jgi:hypothetical protein